VQEHIRKAIGIGEHEIIARRGEGDVPPLGVDGGLPTGRGRLCAIAADTDACCRVHQQVPHVDVIDAVGVCGYGRGCGGERHEASITADAGRGRTVGQFAADFVQTDAHRGAGPPVVDEHIGVAVGVAYHEVRCVRDESHEVPIAADAGRVGVIVALHPAAAQTHPRGCARLPVAQVDVGEAIGVAGHEGGRGGDERDMAAVGGDGRLRVGPHALHTHAVETDDGDGPGGSGSGRVRNHRPNDQQGQDGESTP